MLIVKTLASHASGAERKGTLLSVDHAVVGRDVRADYCQLASRIASVHAQQLAADEAGPVRRDEQDCVGDLVGGCKPPERHLGNKRLLVLRILARQRNATLRN